VSKQMHYIQTLSFTFVLKAQNSVPVWCMHR